MHCGSCLPHPYQIHPHLPPPVAPSSSQNVFSFASEEAKAQGAGMLDTLILVYQQLDEALLHTMQEGASLQDVAKAQVLISQATEAVTTLEAYVAAELKKDT